MTPIKANNKTKKQKLLIDGHYFIKFKDLKGTISWCCDKKGTLKCSSIVKTCLVDGSYDIKYGPTEHNHEDPKNRKLIVATPRKSVIGKAKRTPLKLAPIELDFEEKQTTTEHDQTDPENKSTPETAAEIYLKKIIIPYVDQPIIPDFGVQEIKFFKWREDRTEKLFIDGFYYTLDRINKKRCIWVCSNTRNNLNCRGRVTTIFTSGAHKLKYSPCRLPHNHDKADIPAVLKRYICDGGAAPIRKKRKRPLKVPMENLANVSMHTQLMSRIPQTDDVEFPPPMDCEIEFVILFGLRRKMMPEQIFYELQGIYGLDAPSFGILSKHCRRFQAGYYPKNDSESQKREYSMNLKNEINDDLNISKEFLTVQPDINSSNIL